MYSVTTAQNTWTRSARPFVQGDGGSQAFTEFSLWFGSGISVLCQVLYGMFYRSEL